MIGDERVTCHHLGLEEQLQDAMNRALEHAQENNESLGELKYTITMRLDVRFRRAERERGQKVGDVAGPDIVVKDAKVAYPERLGKQIRARLDGQSVVVDGDEDEDGVRQIPFKRSGE